MIPFTQYILPFDALSKQQLYHLLQLRSEVFVVEQQCVFQDMDGLDQQALHLLWYDTENELVAYTRLLPPASKYPEPSIGRVITRRKIRGNGYGRALMEASIKEVENRWPGHPIKLFGQIHLEDFYSGMGFKSIGEPEDEDGIMHVYMVRASIQRISS